MSPLNITALHLYHPEQLQNFFRKIRPALAISEELWLASSDRSLLEAAVRLTTPFEIPVRLFSVSNTWHDWSGFLAFLRAYSPGTRLIVANDSITTRRVLSNWSVNSLVQTSLVRTHALVGELDIAKESVTIQSESSACWISTYLFAISGVQVNTYKLEELVSSEVDQTFNDRGHFFNRYLIKRRPSLVLQPDLLKAKLGAMFFERHLTRIASTQGADIVHVFAGSRLRKIERLLERFKDA